MPTEAGPCRSMMSRRRVPRSPRQCSHDVGWSTPLVLSSGPSKRRGSWRILGSALPVGRALHGGFLPGVARADSVKARLTKLRGFEADRVDETRHIGEVLLVRDIGAE